MSFQEILFYILDVILLVQLVRLVMTTRTIKVPTDAGFRWLMPLLILIATLVGYLRGDNIFSSISSPYFKYIQTCMMVIFAILYWFVGSGLSDEGVISMGRLTPYKESEKMIFNVKDVCLTCQGKKRTVNLFFDADQIENIHKHLRDMDVVYEIKD